MASTSLASTTDRLLVAIVCGSTRPGRRSARVATWPAELAADHDAVSCEVVDLADQDLPMFDEAIPPLAGAYEGEHTQRWAATIARFDAFVFVTPEYNHSAPAALKNALDFLFAEWNDKAAGFVSYGVDGGVRAVEHLRGVMGELKLADVRSQMSLSLTEDWRDYLDPATFAPRDEHREAVAGLLDDLAAWGGALRTLRSAA